MDNQQRYDLFLDRSATKVTPRTKAEKRVKRMSTMQLASMAGDFGFALVLPVLIAFLVGTRLDAIWGTGHTVTYILAIVGMIVGILTLKRRVNEIIKK